MAKWLTLLLLPLQALAAVPSGWTQLTWTHPTARTDGVPLLPTMISGTDVERGTCAGAAFGSPVQTTTLTGVQDRVMLNNLPAGTWCFRLYTRTTDGLRSDPSPVVKKVIPVPCGSGCHG